MPWDINVIILELRKGARHDKLFFINEAHMEGPFAYFMSFSSNIQGWDLFKNIPVILELVEVKIVLQTPYNPAKHNSLLRMNNYEHEKLYFKS